ncbi:hypothetical protein NDU88_010949 [Pleurodeles waltl]|uniref:Uncharacterized protein n=1 Tax=Pleurodeles waltl TaxID=8319 RepID=A0AAV7PWB6_PLEWA|nr:hypothetical protein NDU88_010949 [Pleurodeles waltl]
MKQSVSRCFSCATRHVSSDLVTAIRFLGEHELQKMFKVVLLSHDDVDQIPEEARTISVQKLLEERGFLQKKSIVYIIILVALITMAISLLGGYVDKGMSRQLFTTSRP